VSPQHPRAKAADRGGLSAAAVGVRRRVGGTGTLSELGEELHDVVHQDLRSLVRGVVAGGLVDVPADDVRVVAVGEPADAEEVVRRAGQRGRTVVGPSGFSPSVVISR